MKREAKRSLKLYKLKVLSINNAHRFFVMWLSSKLDEDDGSDR